MNVCAGITTVTTTTRAPVTSTTGEVYFSLDEMINQSEQKVIVDLLVPKNRAFSHFRLFSISKCSNRNSLTPHIRDALTCPVRDEKKNNKNEISFRLLSSC